MASVRNETRDDLTALIEADFGRLSPSMSFSDVLLDWLHFRARSIPARPREVIVSPMVESHRQAYPAINEIVLRLKAGVDVGPWLSDRVRVRKTNPRADMMFNDWQIAHFHLGRVFATPRKINRTSPLLYAFVSAEHAVLLDVQPHGKWAMRDLLRILLECSPDDMKELHGIAASKESWSDQQLATLRGKHVNGAITIDGRVFASPGLGILSSGGAVRISHFGDQLLAMIKNAERDVIQGTLPSPLMRSIVAQIGLPVKLGVRLDRGVFYVYDKARNIDITHSHPLE